MLIDIHMRIRILCQLHFCVAAIIAERQGRSNVQHFTSFLADKIL